MINRFFLRPCAAVLGASLTIGSFANSAPAAVLYQESFEDATINGANAGLRLGTVAGGIANFDDQSTGGKANIWVVQNFESPVMTFSFDVVAPVTQPDIPGAEENGGADNDLLFRASIGTGGDISPSGEAILEQILFRDGNRTGYANSGNESVFVVANNSADSLVFASPVDGADVTLTGFQYAVYVRNNAAEPDTFAQAKGPTSFADRDLTGPGFGTITRIAVGNSSNGNLGTFSIDNVGVVDAVSFETVAVPEPSALALLGLGGLLALRRRRSA